MAITSLTPYKVKVHGKERWRLYLGRQDGKDRYETFAIKEDAEARARELKPRRRKQGEEAAKIPANDLLRWDKINKHLLELGSSLAAVGEKAITDLKKITMRGTLGEMRAAFFKSESNDLEDVSLRDIRNRAVLLCKALGGDSKPASVATRQAVSAFLSSLKTGRQDRINYRRTSNRWLGWAALNGWLPENPVPPPPKGKAKEKTRARGKAVTLSPAEARGLLKLAIESGDLQVVSHLAISLFAGLRPAEFRGRFKINNVSRTVTTDWEDLQEGMVHVKAECSKIRMGRQFDAHPTLTAWLDWIRAQTPGNVLKGPILSGYWTSRWRKWRLKYAKDLLGNMRGRGKGVYDGTMVDRRDVLRHTFGSCRYADTKSLEITANEMGNSPDVVSQYYYDYRSHGKIATEFWTLTPAVVMKPMENNSQ
jgi:hypothetical protein